MTTPNETVSRQPVSSALEVSIDVPQPRTAESGAAGEGPLRYASDDGFWQELRGEVEAHFRVKGISGRDAPAWYFKSAVLVVGWIGLYALLVFAALPAWLAVAVAAALGLASAALGLNIAHDGGHKAASRHPWINRIAAFSLDLVGGSSAQWRWKHGVLHHQYVNLAGWDTDIDLGVLGRLSPYQRRRFFHRWQHIYLWPLYGFLALKWHLLDDFRDAARGFPGKGGGAGRGKIAELAVMLLGKALFFGIVFVLPSRFHPIGVVLGFYVLANLVQGITLSVVFQLAHAVEGAAFPAIPADRRVAWSWAAHQVRTSTDFCRGNRPLAWLLGGINFQVEHHLFPQVCHVHYPDLAPIVGRVCRNHGLPHREHPTFLAGIGSHYRWLKRMGRPA